uniref:RING-type domain-containing protein n=1 Tax=Meloidogyne javanica TaxID=6303 RepID=A0A915MAB9_MELJA
VTDVSLDEQRPLQQPQSPTSVTPTHGRAHSTPAALNSSDGSSNGSGSSFVINMEDDLSRVTNQLHRRRSSSPLRNMHNDAASSNGVIPSFSPQLTQRTPTNNAATGTRQEGDDQNIVTTVAVASGASDASGGSGDSDEDEDPTLRNLRNRFRQLLRRRHQILRNFIQQMGEVNVVAFKRYISGTGNGWFIGGKIALRQFMVLQVLGQSSFVFPAATFREASVSFINNPSFWSTLYIVLITEYFVLDCLLAAKLLVANLPKCSTVYKRRLYQWLEYSGALYRFALPFVQWNAYLGALWWTVVYGGIKILLSFAMIWGWILTTLRIFRFTHLGTTPTPSECKQNENCTICFSEYTSPVKLKCSHIFCSECIRTWLDREHTCPICRTIVTKEDNNYRNGESMFPCIF